jgi:integrase
VRQKLTDTLVKKRALPSQEEAQLEIWDTALPGFGVRLGWKGRRSFMVMTRVNGRQRRFTVGTYPAMSLGEARGEARKILDDAARGIDPKERREQERAKADQRRRETFEAVADKFIEDYVKAKRLRTAREIERCLRRDVVPAWGSRSVHDITRRDLKELLRRKASTSPAAANKVLEIVRKLYNWALDEEIVETSPALRVIAPAPPVERERVLTNDELRLFWNASAGLGHPFGPLYRIAALTAQRRGEVARMQWSQLDLHEGTWLLPAEQAKGGVGHLVPLSAPACQVLSAIPRIGEHVFASGQTDNRPPSGFSKAKRRLDAEMQRLAEEEPGSTEAAVQIAPWRVHDLRRTAATRMRELGVDRLTVSKVLNHREAGVTRIYDRFAMDPEKRRALELWAAYLDGMDRGEPNVISLLRAGA